MQREGAHLKSWPIAEMTLTVQPAEPRLIGTEVLHKLYGDNPPEDFVKVEQTSEVSEEKQSVDDTGEKIVLLTALFELLNQRLKNG